MENRFDYKLYCLWNDTQATYVYVLNKIIKSQDTLHTSYTGDAKWAERIAAHYGLDMPEEPEDTKNIKVTVDGEDR